MTATTPPTTEPIATPAAGASTRGKLTMRCSNCDSEDVVRDAWACWSFERQEWELSQIFDYAYCEACEGDCKIERSEPAAPRKHSPPFYE
jgi:hypothetical protein